MAFGRSPAVEGIPSAVAPDDHKMSLGLAFAW
jgi:hypothetical protein